MRLNTRTLLVVIVGCSLALIGSPGVNAASESASFESAIHAMLTEADHPFLADHDLTAESNILAAIYEQHQYRPLWFPKRQPSRQATVVLQALRAAPDEGLLADDYEANRIIYELFDSMTDAGADASRWAQLDLALSTVTLRWITHLHYGRIDPRSAGFNTPVMEPTHLDRGAVLSRLADADQPGDIIAEIEPRFRHYRLLKDALPRYRRLAADPTLTILPPLPSRSINAGDAYEGSAALRRLLHATGDLEEIATASTVDLTLDPALVPAVKRFQRRHGLAADGTIGKTTFAALTTPLTQRVRQIELTLERWRWLPGFDRPPIIVNIPQFRLFAFRSLEDSESDMLQMDVIVGQTFTRMRTPIFAADMTYVVFRPYWDVPYSIASREILPQLRAKPNYLAAQNLEIVRGPGDDAQAVAATAENVAALASGQLLLRHRP
jgi:L,D-transpeptidase YcbB